MLLMKNKKLIMD